MLTEIKDRDKESKDREAPASACKLEEGSRKHPRGLVTGGALLLLSATAVVSTGVAVWAWRSEGPAQAAAQTAVEERDQARKAETEAKHQREQALAARQTTAEQRDQALASEKEAKRLALVNRTVLDFIQHNLLAAGHSQGWSGGEAKDLTLRKAVDAAEAKVGKLFADQPLVEASIREILGSSYLDLADATLAVKQYERAFELREKVLGADHPETGDCRNKLAVAYRLAGRIGAASRLYEQQSDKNPRAKTESR